MKEVIRYVADDGTEFVTPDTCRSYEVLCLEVTGIMSALVPCPTEGKFLEGYGYVQQDTITVAVVAERLKKVTVGREGYPCVFRAKERLHQIDIKGREWGRRFYISNPRFRLPLRINSKD